MILIRLLLNWRVYLLSLLLSMVALMSFSQEKMDLYAGWWLEHQYTQYTTWQTERKKVRLPAWYNRIHSIICSLRSQKNNDNHDKNLLILCICLLIVGITCLYLAAWIINRMRNDGSDKFPKGQLWTPSFEGAANIIKVGVAVSVLSSPIAEATVNSSLGMSDFRQPYALLEDCPPASPPVCSGFELPSKARPKDSKQGGNLRTKQQGSGPVVKTTQCKKNTRFYPKSTEKQMKKFYRTLSEKDRRRYTGVEALKLGHGGIVYIAKVVGCDRKTVSKGIDELKKLSRRSIDRHRIRKRGGGRKPYHVTHPDINGQFFEVVKNNTAGDPMREDVKWTDLAPAEIMQLLSYEYQISVSARVAKQLLKENNYHLRQMLKKTTMKEVPYRNEQFVNIGQLRSLYFASSNPIISMDTKKKEYLGNFYRNGHLYTRETIYSYDHDFKSFAKGIIIPHSIYDMKKNKGYIHLGTSHDTSEFACDCIKNWWLKYGQYEYPDAASILILCDGGGSNSSRHYIFKWDLQNLVNEIGVEIRIAHYPPYCSKWNPIEHRLFPHITRACQGVIFENIELVKSLMLKTKTRQGLSVEAEIFDRFYQTGRKVNDDFKENMGILFDDYLPCWNYRAIPNGEVN